MPQGKDGHPLRVLVVTPTGREGRGGIDRLYTYLREAEGRGAMPDIALDFFAARGPREGWRSGLSFPSRAAAFALRLARGDVDLVHLNHSTHGSAGRKAVLAGIAHLFRRPVVTHFHGLVTPTDAAANPLWLRLLARMSRRADRVIVLGRAFVPFLAGHGVALERIAVVPNGIPDFAPEAPAKAGPPLVLFAGEVGTRKGVDLLIPALARLIRHDGAGTLPWTCVIAGNGEIARYAAQAQAAGLGERVRFTGWLSSADTHALMRQAAVVVLPSRIEGLPLTLIEGACAGAALVASDVGAIPDLVRDGVNGRIVPLDADTLANALADLLAEPARLAAMGRASRALYEDEFGIDVLATRLAALYVAVARSPRARIWPGSSTVPPSRSTSAMPP